MYSKNVTAATSGDNTILDASADGNGPGSSTALGSQQFFRITAIEISTIGTVVAKFYDGASSGGKRRRSFTLKATSEASIAQMPFGVGGNFDLAVGANLVLNLSGAVSCEVNVSYVVVGPSD